MDVFYDEQDSFGLYTVFSLCAVIEELEGTLKGQIVGIMPKYILSVLVFKMKTSNMFQSHKSSGLNH